MNIEKATNHEQHGIFRGRFHEKTKNFLSLSGDPIYTEELFASIDDSVKLLASFPDKTNDGLMLTGSFARYLAGCGKTETNWHIREKAKEMHSRYIFNPTHKADFTRVSKPDQDIDVSYAFTNGGSLEKLYAFVKSNTPNAVETTTVEIASDKNEIHVTHLTWTDRNNTHIDLTYGPNTENPELTHMTMGFYNSQERLFHIDIAKYPTTGLESEIQNRSGGDSNEAQDILIPIHLNDEGETEYVLDATKIYNLLHKESVNLNAKDMKSFVNLTLRALRIHLIHSEDLFTNPSPKILSQLFYSEKNETMEKNNIFDIFDFRKRIQEDIQSGKKLSEKSYALLKTELLICMANDPFETAKFLQDTGFYLLIPGLRNFNHEDWKNLFTSNAFTFLRDGTPIPRKDARDIESIQYSHAQFKLAKWNTDVNGIKMFIHAFGEAMKRKVPNLNLLDYDQMYELLFFTESKTYTPRKQFTSVPNALIDLFKIHPSGVTEREMQGYLQAITPVEVSREEYQQALFEMKQRGIINRQTRYTDQEKKVVFYSPRLNVDGSLNLRTTPLTHPEIHNSITDIPYIESDTKNVLEQLLQQLSCRSIESFRPLRSYEREFLANDMEKLLQENGNKSISKETMLQFVTEVQQACVAYSRKRGL